MQNISIYMLIDNIKAKNFVKFDFMKIMIHLAWLDNSMVIFSASYGPQIKPCRPKIMPPKTKLPCVES